ncbi:MAG: caspase family protein [Bacteroidaceae bacterium]|nr:caspase family protein [Bacteroidaceae bacterium]
MKKYIILFFAALLCLPSGWAKSSIYKTEGTCGPDVKWAFDGLTLTIVNASKEGAYVAIPDYDMKHNIAPWTKKKLDVKKVQIGSGITRVGSCSFAGMENLQEVVFLGRDVVQIGWGAFLGCSRLRNISLPIGLRNIETIAFARCTSLNSVKIPDQCRVADQAFVSCTNLQSVELSPTAILGRHVFANEVKINNRVRHALYSGEVRRLPTYINAGNAAEYGFTPAIVEKFTAGRVLDIDYDYMTSGVDSIIPQGYFARNNTYALIIGNQNYRFVSDVPYAIHDARVFAEYCQKTLGIPAQNIHLTEDATKQMILEEELEDWVERIPDREKKSLIVYYAGHGVPDVKNKNKAYILPTDVRGTSPQRGIALDAFYSKLGELAFHQTSVFLDACFSGVNRENEGVTDGLRGVEIEAEEAELGGGSVVVFSAAQGNETAQGYPEQGHGLFTYYLLKEMQETGGMINFGLLSDRLQRNVSTRAPQLKMRKAQTPATTATQQAAETWREMQF